MCIQRIIGIYTYTYCISKYSLVYKQPISTRRSPLIPDVGSHHWGIRRLRSVAWPLGFGQLWLVGHFYACHGHKLDGVGYLEFR